MFVEVQRADTKATALCGVTGALLAIVVGTALSTPVGASHLLRTAVTLVGALLGAALISALRALRPTFPKDDALVWREEFPGGGSAGEHAPSSEREAFLTGLARRKFRAIRLGVDLTVAAITVAGLVLLLIFVVS